MHVENFRGLVDERIEFDESMTVLAGGNGGGKSSLLEAISIMLSWLPAGLPSAERTPMNELSTDYHHMMAPVDGRGEELYFRTNLGSRACGVVYNERLELGAYVAFDTANLPNMVQWKMMKSHDYVLALEPCNTFGINRDEAAKEGKLAVLPAYASVENHLELGVLDGLTEIRSFLRQL